MAAATKTNDALDVRIQFREDSYNGGYRVWLSSWQGDQFKIVHKANFDQAMNMLGHEFFNEHGDDD